MQNSSGQTLTLGDIELDAVIRDGRLSGIGAVTCSGYPLRSATRPWWIDLRTPDGVELSDFALAGVRHEGDAVYLDLTMSARSGGQMEWMLHEVRPRINTSSWSAQALPLSGTQLTLELHPVRRQIGSAEAVGFSYQFHYQSDEHAIYKILDRGTWEPGGSVTGCEFWLRNAFVESVYSVASCSQSYSTEWYLPTAANPDIFQFMPWQSGLEGLTMTWRESGGLLTWATRPAHIRSLWEKKPGSDELEHWHEHCGDLSYKFASAPVEVLWISGTRDHVERINVWHDARELVSETLHEEAGLRRERVKVYGTIEEWTNADLVAYREKGLPKLLEAGARTIFLPSQFQNNMSTFGVGNMCCTIDYRVEETVGEQNLTEFCMAAKSGGAEVEMWGNTALSTFGLKTFDRNGETDRIRFLPTAGSVAEMLQSARDPFVRNSAGHTESDHYTPVFAQLNMRDHDVRAYWMKRWTYAREQIGLSGIFLDSSFNMTSDKFHWVANPQAKADASATVDQTDLLGHHRPVQEPSRAILSQFLAHLSLVAEMQAKGYVYCGEDIGVFGVHRSGPGIEKRLTNLWMWQDCVTVYDVPSIEAAGGNPTDVFFNGLAYRLSWNLFWDIKTDVLSWRHGSHRGPYDVPTNDQLALLTAFTAVTPYMRSRTVLDNETGVQYSSGTKTVLWAFENLDLPISGEVHITDVLSGDAIVVNETLRASKHRVYLLDQG